LCHFLGARCPRGGIITHAPVVDGLQLSKVANQDDGQISELAGVGVHVSLGKEAALGLLKAEVHAGKKRPADEGHLVHDEQLDAPPLVLEVAELVVLKLLLPARIREYLEAAGGRFGAEADVERGHAGVCGELDRGIHRFALEQEPDMLNNGS